MQSQTVISDQKTVTSGPNGATRVSQGWGVGTATAVNGLNCLFVTANSNCNTAPIATVQGGVNKGKEGGKGIDCKSAATAVISTKWPHPSLHSRPLQPPAAPT